MRTFKIIDITTGKEVSAEKIEKIAKENGLMDMDIDQFFIGEDGQLVLADDCGNLAYCDMEQLGFMPVFEGKYPDLDYLESVFLGNIHKLCPEAFKTGLLQPQAELIDMFPQTWPSTAGGFSEPGMFSGQALTTELTTVMRVYIYTSKTNYYGVFFGNKPAYIIDNENADFVKDLKEHSLKSKHDAQEVY